MAGAGSVTDADGVGEGGKTRRARAGHQEVLGETIAKFELFRHGWNPYSRFLDHEKIDLVARKNTGSEILYADVQVKQSRLYPVGERWARPLFDVTSWGFFKPDTFDSCNPNLVVAMVLVHPDPEGEGASITDYRGDIFLFSALEFSRMLKEAVPSLDNVKVFLVRDAHDAARWYWCRRWDKGMSLSPDCVIDISKHRQALGVLDAVAFRHAFSDPPG